MDSLRIRGRHVNLTTLTSMQSCTTKHIITCVTFYEASQITFIHQLLAHFLLHTRAFGNYTVSIQKEKDIFARGPFSITSKWFQNSTGCLCNNLSISSCIPAFHRSLGLGILDWNLEITRTHGHGVHVEENDKPIKAFLLDCLAPSALNKTLLG